MNGSVFLSFYRTLSPPKTPDRHTAVQISQKNGAHPMNWGHLKKLMGHIAAISAAEALGTVTMGTPITASTVLKPLLADILENLVSLGTTATTPPAK